jgi:hypothetical protein
VVVPDADGRSETHIVVVEHAAGSSRSHADRTAREVVGRSVAAEVDGSSGQRATRGGLVRVLVFL